MYTYIKNNIHGIFFTSNVLLETIDGYQDSVGTTWEDYENGKFLKLSNEQVKFLNQNPGLNVYNIWTLTVPEDSNINESVEVEKTLEDIRQETINKIYEYDSSDEINSVFFGENKVWFDKETRICLRNRIEAELFSEYETTVFWFDGIEYVFDINEAKNILMLIEIYASKCYDNTQMHIANVNSIDNIEEIQNYDYTSGYPETLHFQ